MVLAAAEGPAAQARPEDPSSGRGPVDFVADVQPIFARHCLECHGPGKQRSGYRLDHRDTARRGGESREPAILPGDASGSRLFRMVTGALEDQRMPPQGDPLSPGELEVLRVWIDQGAAWPEAASVVLEDPLEWWSLRPMAPVPVPATRDGGDGGRHPIDAFIRARLEREGRDLSSPADRRILIRRVTFGLLGLPPTPEEVAAFVADPDPEAYERLVERLLASPHYGERWARQWMDVVHYGDTHGYDKDKPRPHAWPYRDYLIRAFNEDRPYGRWVREQVAGDVFFPDSADGIEALGFLAAGPWDLIGHEELPETKIDGKIARHLDRDDMVSNTLGTFASVTVHCAQCHDHKFDPVPQEDYYRLQAVFSALDRTDRRYHREPGLNRRRAELEAELRRLGWQERELQSAVHSAGGEALSTAEAAIRAAEQAARGGQPAEYGYHSEIAATPATEKWVQVDLGRAVALDRIVLAPCRDDFNNIGDGFGFPPRYRVELATDPVGRGEVVTLVDHSGEDQPNPGIHPVTVPAGGRLARYVRVTATRLAPRQGDFIFALAELEALDAAGVNVARGAPVTARDSIEAPVRWARAHLTDGKAPGKTLSGEDLAVLRAQREEVLARHVPAALREDLGRVAEARVARRRELEALPPALVAYVGTIRDGQGNFRGTGPDGGRPRPIHVLARGDVRTPGREVGPGALTCVGLAEEFEGLGTDSGDGERRAALARWLTHPDHPLTWRSIVNRVWQRHFGRGLVETPNDFGRMGGTPSHPELLDWLAQAFRDGGQSFKTLDRWIVTSATYRQGLGKNGERTEGGAEPFDPENRLLSRWTARRLDAEEVRDSLLAVSGKLDRALYGPGFQDFVIEKPEHSPHYQYHRHDPEDPRSHRRAVYRFLVRSQQEPFMVALDCADPSMRVDRRTETLTPLQALALMNSRLSVTMARHFAGRVEQEAGAGVEAQVRRAFLLAVQREPGAEEAADLADYTRRHGLAATCRLLFNLNEFVFVD